MLNESKFKEKYIEKSLKNLDIENKQFRANDVNTSLIETIKQDKENLNKTTEFLIKTLRNTSSE
jgi:hypothetical protein